MTALEFLRSQAADALLARAATAAGVPLSIHYVERNQEGPRICGWGQCAACRHVQSLPGGGAACRMSRATAANMALRQQRPLPFICHLGFACVSAPLLAGEGYVMTLGPFGPMEEQRSLEGDIRAGFEALIQQEIESLPVSLDDIHRAPSASLPAIAAWTVEVLRRAWDEAREAERIPVTIAVEDPVAVTRRRSAAPRESGVEQEIAAALAGRDFPQVRQLFQGELEELQRNGGKSIDVRRARVVSLAGAAVEAVARTGVPVAEAWNSYPLFIEVLAQAESDSQLLNAAMGLFAFLRGAAVRERAEEKLPNYPELYALVKDRLLEGVTLEEVAAHLGETPSAISHRLRRKFGMSYSDYVGRIRIDKAKQLFRRTGLGTTEVAQRVGISDQSNFARLFRKVEGISPSAYRKQFGKKS